MREFNSPFDGSLVPVDDEKPVLQLINGALKNIDWEWMFRGVPVTAPFERATFHLMPEVGMDGRFASRLVTVRYELGFDTRRLMLEWGRKDVEAPELSLYQQCALNGFFHPRGIVDAFNRLVSVTCNACAAPMLQARV